MFNCFSAMLWQFHYHEKGHKSAFLINILVFSSCLVRSFQIFIEGILIDVFKILLRFHFVRAHPTVLQNYFMGVQKLHDLLPLSLFSSRVCFEKELICVFIIGQAYIFSQSNLFIFLIRNFHPFFVTNRQQPNYLLIYGKDYDFKNLSNVAKVHSFMILSLYLTF